MCTPVCLTHLQFVTPSVTSSLFSEGVRCSVCKGQRKALHSIYTWISRQHTGKQNTTAPGKALHSIYTRISRQHTGKENRTAPGSHVNYCHLTTPEKRERLSRLHSAARVAQQHVIRLKACTQLC